MAILNDIAKSVEDGRAKVTEALVQQALDEGVPAKEILEKGLMEGMNVIGVLFRENEVYVPEVMVAARAMNKGAALLKPYLAWKACRPPARFASAP